MGRKPGFRAKIVEQSVIHPQPTRQRQTFRKIGTQSYGPKELVSMVARLPKERLSQRILRSVDVFSFSLSERIVPVWVVFVCVGFSAYMCAARMFET